MPALGYPSSEQGGAVGPTPPVAEMLEGCHPHPGLIFFEGGHSPLDGVCSEEMFCDCAAPFRVIGVGVAVAS